MTRPAGRMLQLIALAAAVAITGVFATAPVAEARSSERVAKPTIVLVHGAWASPSGWNKVVGQLKRDGYRVAAPRLDLQSVADDVDIVRRTLDSITGDKVLVGHSYGGFIVSNAAAGRSDVVGLVFTAAFVPDHGESIVDTGVGYEPPEALNHLVFTGAPGDSPALIDSAFFPELFAQDLRPAVAARLNAGQQAVDLSTFFTPSGVVAWHAVPSWYAVSGADRMIDPAQQRFMARRAGATTVEFKGASHAGGYTRYAARLTTLIERAAKASSMHK